MNGQETSLDQSSNNIRKLPRVLVAVVVDEEGEVTLEGKGEVGEMAEMKEEARLLIMPVNVRGKRRIRIEQGKVGMTEKWRDRVPAHLPELILGYYCNSQQ